MASFSKTFKVSHNGAFLRFSLSFTENDENPLEKVLEALRNRGVPMEQGRLFWLDDEESRIYLRNTLDWKDCLQANSGDLLRLLVVPEREGSVEVVYENNNNNGAIVEEPRSPRRSRSPNRCRRRQSKSPYSDRSSMSRCRSGERDWYMRRLDARDAREAYTRTTHAAYGCQNTGRSCCWNRQERTGRHRPY